jgi:hypothetical protein
LIVSVLDSDGNPNNILIPNIPVQTPFRLGIVLMNTVFEVYLNGKLVRTLKYDSGAAGNYTGAFSPPYGNTAKSVRVGNLILWNRLASAGNIRYAKPTLMSAIASDTGNASDSCSTLTSSLSSFEDTLVQNANRMTSIATAELGKIAETSVNAVQTLTSTQ